MVAINLFEQRIKEMKKALQKDKYDSAKKEEWSEVIYFDGAIATLDLVLEIMDASYRDALEWEEAQSSGKNYLPN